MDKNEAQPSDQDLQQPQTPYEDPKLLAEAGGNYELLHRLVGVRIAEQMLAENPDDPMAQIGLTAMKEALRKYRETHPLNS